MQHTAAPFFVLVRSYSPPTVFEAHEVGAERLEYKSTHRSPVAAGRRLASIIMGKSALAKLIRRQVLRRGLRMTIAASDGSERPLTLHRLTFCR